MNTPFTPHRRARFRASTRPRVRLRTGRTPRTARSSPPWHGARRATKFLDQVRAHRGGPFGPGGPGGPGFGRDFGGFGGPGFGFGPRGGRRGPGPRGGGRGKRGDVRAAILKLLTDRPMHGYEMIQEIAERSNDLWKPSPGSVYPTLQMLEDEGLIVATQSEGSKKLFELTDDGKAAAEKIETAPWTEITEGADPVHVNLRAALGQLFGAVAQSANAANRRSAAAHPRHRQQRPPRDLPDPRRELTASCGVSPVLSAGETPHVARSAMMDHMGAPSSDITTMPRGGFDASCLDRTAADRPGRVPRPR